MPGTLADILGVDLTDWLNQPPAIARYRTPEQLDRMLESWAASGAARVEVLGSSREGRPIRCAVFGSGARTMLAWGYPHPDEPLGAEALCWLGERLAAGQWPPGLEGWRMVLVLCADPDQASRQLWAAGPRDADTFCAGCFRPSHLGLEVDYGFPLHWGPFDHPADYEGACRTSEECEERCGPGGCRYERRPRGPLPESLALADAIDRFVPDAVFSLHNTHTGGDYTFLLERERRETMLKLLDIPAACGTGRHLGEPMDRGRRWLRDQPDLIVERNLQFFARRLYRNPRYDPGFVYLGNHSAGAYVEAAGRGAQFCCPESTMFRHPDFSDRSPLDEMVPVWMSVEDRPKAGRCEVIRIADSGAGGALLLAHQSRVDLPLQPPTESAMPLTRGMLGMLALARRRRTLDRADRLWERVCELDDLRYHPYSDERRRIRVPGSHVHDRSALIFRTDPAYRQPATVAQAASFRWQWPLHTATLLGNMANFLAFQDQSRPQISRVAAELAELQSAELSALPPELRSEAPRGPALRSILARVFCLMLARE